MRDYQSLRLEASEGVLTLSLLGPSKGNAMGPEFWAELPQAIDAIEQDKSIRVIIIKGSGEHFSYGLDLPRMLPKLGNLLQGQIMAEKRLELKAMIQQMQSGFQKMYKSPIPVIAAVHGWCIGGGLNMISAADIRLCSADAKFSLRETKLAITPDIGGLQWLPHIIGQGFTRELAYTAKDFDAEFAEKIGLINHVYASPEELFAMADKMAKQIAANSKVAVQGSKQVLNQGVAKSIEEGLDYVSTWNAAFLQSNDFAEMIAASLEKRTPNYK